jgi:hypothetical protein
MVAENCSEENWLKGESGLILPGDLNLTVLASAFSGVVPTNQTVSFFEA